MSGLGGKEFFAQSAWVQSAWLDGSTPSSWLFDCIKRTPCPTNPQLTFTKWKRPE